MPLISIPLQAKSYFRSISTQDAESEFWDKADSKIQSAQSCVEWKACLDPNGYGRVNFKKKCRLAHRVAFELIKGVIPRGMHVLHRCDNPSCVNPLHLFLGTHADNMDDRQSKGRQPHGESMHWAKLSNHKVQEIRGVGGKTQYEIADMFGVHQSTVSRILRRKNWICI
jgi:hypothetical protein